jgi:gliding motility-associated-like protein
LNTLNIRYRPLAEFKVGDLMCNNETIRFTDSSKMPPNGSAEIINKWYWTFDNTRNANSQNVATWFTPGLHKAQLMSETSIGCKSLPVEHSFDIWPKPNVKLDITDSCVDVPVTYTATDLDGDVVKYNWYFLNGKKEGTSYILTRYYKNEENFPFTLITLTDKGCKDTIYRPFRIYDNKSYIGNDTLVAFNEPVYLSAHGEPRMQYTWTPAIGLDSPYVEKPIATYDKDQLYQLYTVTDKGCKKQSHIKINRFAGPDLYVPNAFTPNNDGHNDLLRVKPIGIKSFDYFAVYNRWGQLVFKTTDYKVGWDGTFRGERLVQETFVYIAQATDYKGRPLVRKGTVIMLR